MPESSSASDQANAGGLPTSAATPDRVVASAIGPAAVGANAVSLSAGPRAARSAAPTAAVRCGRGAVMTKAPDCSDRVRVTMGILAPPPTDATAAKSSRPIPLRCNMLWKKPTKPSSGWRIASSRSSRVSRISTTIAGHVGGQLGRDGRRELFFGIPAGAAQRSQGADRRRCRRVERTRRRQIGDDVGQQRLVDPVAGEFGVPHGGGDGLVAVRGIDQGESGSRAAEIANGDDSAARHSRVRLQGDQRCRGVRQHRQSSTRPFGHPAQRDPHCVDRCRVPVRGMGDGDRIRQCSPVGGGVCQCPQRVGDQRLAAMRRAVGGRDAGRISHPVHEIGDHQARAR